MAKKTRPGRSRTRRVSLESVGNPDSPPRRENPIYTSVKTRFVQGSIVEKALEQYNQETTGYELLENAFHLGAGRSLQGSSPPGVSYMQPILERLGMQVASPRQIAGALKTTGHGSSYFPFGETRIDLGLVVRNEDLESAENEIERFFLENLLREIAKKTDKPIQTPIAVANTDLEVVKDGRARYGLKLRLKEQGQPFYAPSLRTPGRFYLNQLDQETALPTIGANGEGNTSLYLEGGRAVTRWYIEKSVKRTPLDSLVKSAENGRIIVLG